ncbi:hypothetical protein [Streptomyces achromogenes]|uniref:hypothetical protein n=1 Tax=Streptomyces achromogenes TaxID=67255 RepID=UPI0027D77B58|nr:hypothetical protein [Streptomyces achromogenes]
MTTTTARASSWHGSGGLSFDWGIVKIEGETGHDVTKTTSTGKTVSNTLNVPGHYYGYTTPKVERRHFDIDKYEETPACKPRHLAKSGWSDAITAYPFFSECVGTSACTPKP